MMPQSPGETSSHTCGNDGHTDFIIFFINVSGATIRPTHLWHSCPMPSKGCKTPVEDSPWARKNTTGLYFDKALQKELLLLQINRCVSGVITVKSVK